MADRDRQTAVLRAARAGAAVAEAAFRGPLDVETKASPTDLVTDADRNAQRAVVEVIRDVDRDGTIVAEEDDAPAEVPADGIAWLVDPIDGTRNYVAGSRLWATSVAAVVDGAWDAAATLMPAYGDDYTLRSDGVTRNDEAVAPSDEADPSTFSVAPLGWWPREERTEFARLCGVLGDRFGDVRRLGSAQATLAMVASGELDAAVATRRMAPWDTVGGVAMVEAAGGTVTDADGGSWDTDSVGLVASNGRAHSTLVDAARVARDPSR